MGFKASSKSIHIFGCSLWNLHTSLKVSRGKLAISLGLDCCNKDNGTWEINLKSHNWPMCEPFCQFTCNNDWSHAEKCLLLFFWSYCHAILTCLWFYLRVSTPSFNTHVWLFPSGTWPQPCLERLNAQTMQLSHAPLSIFSCRNISLILDYNSTKPFIP